MQALTKPLTTKEKKSGKWSPEEPRILFEGEQLLSPGNFPNYDVSPDGQRFLMLKTPTAAASAPPQIIVVQNWLEELRRLMPTN